MWTRGFWDNWFVQAGLDMSLMNPYGCNFSKVIPKGMTFGLNVAAGSNGFFDINFGIVYDLRRNKFYRDVESKRNAYAQPLTGHNWPRFIFNTVASVGVAYIGKTALKAVINEERPDHSDNKSFPSGHAAIAFAAARSIDKEFHCKWRKEYE